MSKIKENIPLKLVNNSNGTVKIPLFGGTQDPINNQINTTIVYEWDLSTETFLGVDTVTIDISFPVAETISRTDDKLDSVSAVVRVLNTMGIGVFIQNGAIIQTPSEITKFGDLTIA